MNINLLDYLDKTVEKLPNKTAFFDEKGEVTFEELQKSGHLIGSFLCDKIKKNMPVIVLTEKSIDTIKLYMGVLNAGCFYAPIDKDMPIQRIETIIGITGSKIALTDAESYDFACTLNGLNDVYSIDAILNDVDINQDEINKRRQATIDTDPAYMIFTSGSTGVPKGVVGSHRALIDYIESIVEAFDLREDDILGNQSPLDYIAGVRDIYLPLKLGASTHLIPKYLYGRPGELFEFLNEKRINTIFWVAPALILCSELKAFDYVVPNYLKKIVFTGSVMPCRHLRVWQENVPDAIYINQYGPTEITASCTYYIVDHLVDSEEKLPIGKPFRNTEILLLDESNNLADIGEQGEICVRGTSLALGYYKEPEKTKDVYVVNPVNKMYDELIYRTGDLGKLNENGDIEFLGRKDNQIKHMGHRVELSEIESVISSFEDIEHNAVLYHSEKQMIYLFFVGEMSNKDIAIQLRKVLPSFMIPRKFIKLDEMPLLFNGKYDKRKLREMM